MTATADISADIAREKSDRGALLSALEDAGANVSHPNAIRCPFHEDTHPSAGIYEKAGAWRFKCQSCEVGGDVFDIRARVQKRTVAEVIRDFKASLSTAKPRARSTAPPLPPSKPKKVYPSPEACIAAAGRIPQFLPPAAQFHKAWTIHDDGVRGYVTARWNLPDGGKTVRTFHRNGVAGWSFGDPNGEYGPHGLPLYVSSESFATGTRIFIVEGEGKVDALKSIGAHAACFTHGAKSVKRSDFRAVAQCDVVLLPDNDNPGAQAMKDAAEMIFKLNPQATVTTAKLPGLGDGEDIVDWLEADGRDCRDASEILAELNQLVEAVSEEPFVPKHGSAVLVKMSSIEPTETSWLWPSRIVLGGINVIVGVPGIGKSFGTMDMTARVSQGFDWPDGTPCPQGTVLIIASEDDPAKTMRPRLDASGADVDKVVLLKGVNKLTGDGKLVEVCFTLADIDTLREAVETLPDLKLIIVDPIGSFLGGKTDANADNEVRAVLAPLDAIAKKTGAAVVIVAHRRKSGGDSADETVLGSRAFTGIARSVIHLFRDPLDRDRRLFLPGKNNLAKEGAGLAFNIIGEPAHVEWESEPVVITADEAMAAERKQPGTEAAALNSATEWLAELLAGGEMLTGEKPTTPNSVQSEAKAAGISWSSVRRAKDALGVVAFKCQFVKKWKWRLPKTGKR